MKRVFTVSLLLLCAFSAAARVLSYAPYSDRLAVRGDQRRDTRHFVLIETEPYDFQSYTGQVVLYDSKGIDGPRVIFPKTIIHFAALFQEHDDALPVILVAAGWTPATYISSNGGRSWRRIQELDELQPHYPSDVDYGGPWTRGLSSSVRIGTVAFPFVVSYRGAVYAIPRTGAPRLLAKTIRSFDNRLIGQNREGTEFVILTDLHSFAAVGLDGSSRALGTPMQDMDAAWITPDGSVYAIVHTPFDYEGFGEPHHRDVYLYRNRRAQLLYQRYRCSPAVTAAVPAHDFSGAWISEACGEEWTTLWRHQPGGKLEMMWQVRRGTAPEIEALHPGASGETVLLQVHREREKQAAFLDPALAVWRVGEPPPAEYDELFLKEGPYKGFVHVDADRIAGGEPFVFDSSFVRPEPPSVPVSPPLAGGDDVIQEWGVVRASLKQRLVLPGALRGNEWRTDLVIYNPLSEAQDVEVTFGEVTKRVTIDAATLRVIDDALLALFGVDDGSGTLQFVPESGVNVKARVYALRDGGTRGYVAGPIDFMNAISPRFPATFAGAFPGSGFRTRLLLTDTTGGGVKADVTRTSALGIEVTGSIEAKSVLENETSSSTPGSLIVRPTSGTGIAGVVTVDERSGDATYFAPDIPAGEWRTIPFVAHVEENGSLLRSDLHLVNFSSQSRAITLEVKTYDTTQWARQQTYSLKPYESRIIADPLKTLFNLTGIARLRHISYAAQGDTSGVRVTARAYRTAADGGTSGTLVPPMNNFQSVTGGESLEILAPLGNLEVTLGLVEVSDQRDNVTKVRVTVFDEHGTSLGAFNVDLPRARGVMNPIALGDHRPAAVRIVIEPLDNAGMVSAYALLTDPVTADTSFVAPALGAKK